MSWIGTIFNLVLFSVICLALYFVYYDFKIRLNTQNDILIQHQTNISYLNKHIEAIQEIQAISYNLIKELKIIPQNGGSNTDDNTSATVVGGNEPSKYIDINDINYNNGNIELVSESDESDENSMSDESSTSDENANYDSENENNNVFIYFNNPLKRNAKQNLVEISDTDTIEDVDENTINENLFNIYSPKESKSPHSGIVGLNLYGNNSQATELIVQLVPITQPQEDIKEAEIIEDKPITFEDIMINESNQTEPKQEHDELPEQEKFDFEKKTLKELKAYVSENYDIDCSKMNKKDILKYIHNVNNGIESIGTNKKDKHADTIFL